MDTNEKGCGCGCSDSEINELNEDGIGWAPIGSDIQVNPDRSMVINAPSGWNYLGFNSTYECLMVPGGTSLTITCSCLGTGSCSPFYYNGYFTKSPIYGCQTSGCAGTCSSTASAIMSGSPMAFLTGGFVNTSISPVIMTPGEILPAAFEAMFYNSAIIDMITTFMSSIYQGAPIPSAIQGINSATAPEGYQFVWVNVCGRATSLILPETAIAGIAVMSGNKSSCACNPASTTTCTKGDKGGAIFCSSGCKSCSLTIGVGRNLGANFCMHCYQS